MGPIEALAMDVGRISTALCIIADAWWYLWSHKVREEYFEELGIPTYLMYIIPIVYAYFGTRILFNYSMKTSTTGMIIAYGLVMFIVHHPIGEGGIGEYPRNIHREVNFINILKYAAVIGGLFTLSGYNDFKQRGSVMEGSLSYAIVLGRAIIGLHYIIESAWFRLYQRELRTTQINLMGGNPIIHVWVVGAIYFFGGLNLWFGHVMRRRVAALLLAILTSLLTVMEGSSISTSLGIYHMTSQARFHHVIINMQIIIGCIMAFAIGGEEVVEFTKKDD